MVNEQFSFKGYEVKTWFSENKDDIKQAITVVSGIVTAILGALNVKSIIGGIVVGGLTLLVPIITRLTIDAIDYFFKK